MAGVPQGPLVIALDAKPNAVWGNSFVCLLGPLPQRNSMTGIRQERIISVVVEPMIMLRMREWP